MRWILIALLIAITGSACGPHQNTAETLTPLEAAVVVDLSPDKVKALLEGGVDPNQRSPRGYTALIHASDALRIPGEREHLSAEDARKADEIVSLLIEHGADPNLQPENGPSALDAAIAASRPVAARLLLSARADPNGGRSGDFTPLMLTAHHCRPEIARDLLQYGADPALRDASGAVAADLAKRKGCSDVVDVIGAAAIAVSGIAPAAARSEHKREWARMSAAHDRLVATEAGRDYERRLIDAHNTFWRFVYERCIEDARKEGLESFRAIAVVDANGVVTRFVTRPNSENLACFAKEMVGKRYPAPPTAPFYERFVIFVVSD